MKKILVSTSLLLILSSCDVGWLPNQKEALKTTLKDGFMKGLDKHNEYLPEEAVDAWVDCVSEKVMDEYESWDAFVKEQTSSKVKDFMSKCEEEFLKEHYPSESTEPQIEE